MNEYQPQQYYGYYPAQYEPAWLAGAMAVGMKLIILMALSAWAISLVRKAVAGEEVEYPL